MARLRLLLASAGRRVELLGAFRAAAAALDVELDVLACDLRPALSAACRSADTAFPAPPAADPGYAEALLALCRREDVTLLVPTIDPELGPLARAAGDFAAAGCRVAVSSPELVALAGDKLATATRLAALGVPTPRSWPAAAARADPAACAWPAFVKPAGGSSGRGARIVRSADELGPEAEPLVVQELLRGVEYTVNLFFDAAGALRCAVPHERLQVRAGEVEKGVTRRLPALDAISRRLAAVLPGPRGALCYQAMVDDAGDARLFEINARFGGGYPLADRAGAPFARWLLEEALGRPSTASDDWREGVTMLRYDAAVFVDG